MQGTTEEVEERFILRASNHVEGSVILPVHELFTAAGVENKEVQDRVTQSIKLHGLLEPLAVSHISVAQWFDNMWEGILPPPMSTDGSKVYRVDMGCNRLRAAIELGYHYISCNVFDSVKEAQKFGVTQRKRSLVWKSM